MHTIIYACKMSIEDNGVKKMDKIVNTTKQVTNSNLKPKIKNTEEELVTALIENIIKKKRTTMKTNGTEKLLNTSLDVLLLIDEFKNRFEKLGEKAKEIAQKDGRTIVTYEDAEEALKQIRAENEHVKKFDQI